MDKGRDTFVKICFIIDIKEFTTYYYSEKYVTFALKFTAFKMMKNHIKLISSLILLFISALIITGCANKKEEGQALFENGLKNMKNGNLPIAYRQSLKKRMTVSACLKQKPISVFYVVSSDKRKKVMS